MDFELINKHLKNISQLRNSKEIEGDYGDQGESNEIYEVYDIGLSDGLFVKIRLGSDSYGYNETVDGVEFVRGKEKKVTVYEF